MNNHAQRHVNVNLCKAALPGLVEAEEAGESIYTNPETLQALFNTEWLRFILTSGWCFLIMQYMIGIKE